MLLFLVLTFHFLHHHVEVMSKNCNSEVRAFYKWELQDEEPFKLTFLNRKYDISYLIMNE